MLDKREPKSKLRLEDAIQMVKDAGMIAYEYQQDREYVPSDQDVQLFETLAETLVQNYWTAQRIARNMDHRARGV